MNLKKVDICVKQPTNVGLCCWEHDKCMNCGWNPVVFKKRHEETLRKYEEKEKEHERNGT